MNMKKYIILVVCGLSVCGSFSQTWTKIKSGSEFTIAIKSDGTLWGWGFNANGQLGMSSTYQIITTPTLLNEDSDWKEIAAGSCHSLAIKNNGSLWGSGLNGNKQISAGEESQYEEFAQIGTDTDWVFIEAGYVSSFAIKKDGSLWAWGYNGNGQLGVGDLEQKSTPTRVGTDNDWQCVSRGGLFVLGLKQDKSLWQWGYFVTLDSSGYVYDNFLTPYCINSTSNWKMVSAGFEAVFALNENGTIWAYGDNTNYALGDSSKIFLNDFTQITQDSNWNSIEAGSVYTFAINKNGELFGWGNNMYGQLGIEKTDNFIPVPTQIDNQTEWKTISAAKGIISGQYIYGMHSVAIKNDSSIMCVAGANYVGQLGLGYTNNEANTSFNCSESAIQDIEQHNNITIYPNPASTQIIINNTNSIKEISIYSICGQKIRKLLLNDTQKTLDVSNLPNGIYVVKINTASGVLVRKVQVVR